MPYRVHAPKIPLLVVAVSMAAGAAAAPSATCYVRSDTVAAADGAASSPTSSYLGLRRKTDKLFDVDINVNAPGDASCAVSGVAKLQGEPGSEVLGLVVRPDPSRKSGRSGNLCQVFVRLSPAAVELATTPAACQAQGLCEGRVDLNGQRFEHANRLPAGAAGPCFERPVEARK